MADVSPDALALLGEPEPTLTLPDVSDMAYADLNPRERRFVDLVAEGRTKAYAARAVGWGGSPWSLYRRLKELDPAIEARRAYLAKKSEVDALSIASEYAAIGFANVQDLVDVDGNPIPLHELPREVAAAIVSLDVTETEVNAELKTRTYKYKLHPKTQALESLVKLFGLEAPKKVALTDAEGKDLPAMTDIEAARRIAFALAVAGRKLDAIDVIPEDQT